MKRLFPAIAGAMVRIIAALSVLAICLVGLGFLTRILMGLVRFGFCGKF